MRRTLTIAQPCHEDWATMTPNAAGRHCAACQKTVVDFTAMSDAEILAHLAGAKPGNTCGRFGASQLERPLQPLGVVKPSRWRAWLAAAVALWGLREMAGQEAKAQAPTEQRALPMNSPLNYSARPDYEGPAQIQRVVRGRIVDRETQEGLPGVSIILKGQSIGTASAADGTFVLPCSALIASPGQAVQLKYLGYAMREFAPTTSQWHGEEMVLALEVQTMGALSYYQPWPWHPRQLYRWTRYWLTRPFRR
jgi:hypothetical protein